MQKLVGVLDPGPLHSATDTGQGIAGTGEHGPASPPKLTSWTQTLEHVLGSVELAHFR